MATNFQVKTQAAAHAEGYQDALRDIAERLSEEGVEGVEEWLKNNLRA